MAKVTADDIRALHRYFVTAETMRRRAQKMLTKYGPTELMFDHPQFAKFFAYTSLWFSTLWVALDGWRQLGLLDEHLREVIADERMARLKGFRNVTFHYVREYVAPRHLDFLAEDSMRWAFDAHFSLMMALARASETHASDS